jgi:hypothetical protein
VKWIARRRPSPALVIALIALFVSLSGVSYGVATGFIDSREIKNNEVRTGDLRNNDIRTRDLRNNEVRGRDIRNSTVQGRDIALNTVRGVDVREDSLDKVPSAANADSAATAGSATTAGSVSSLKIIPATNVAQGGQPVALASHGPLTLFGECLAGATPRASVSTTEDNSAGAGTGRLGTTVDSGFQEPDLDSADGRVRIAEAGHGMNIRGYGVAAVSALAPSGKAFSGELGLFGDSSGGGSCRFHGSLALQG